VGEVYAACFSWDGCELHSLGDALVAPPDALTPPDGCTDPGLALHCIGSGFVHRDLMHVAFRRSSNCDTAVVPEAQDMLPMAEAALRRGEGVPAASAVPDYVQERTGWKTLAEQGRQA
jgi:tRNA threonylcarbamoyladenosine biosynthesis protein TsaB